MENMSFSFPEKKGATDEQILDQMIVARCKTLTHSLDYCIEVSPWTRQQVADQMGIPIGQLNRMLNPNDQMNFPNDRLTELEELCGNNIPLRFHALSRNHGIHRLKSDVEKENENLRQKVQELEMKHMTILEFFKAGNVDVKLAN